MADSRSWQAIESKLLFGLAAALVLLIGIGGSTWLSLDRHVDTSRSVAHTYEVLGAIDDVVGATRDIEAAQRSYVLTGDETYLQPLEGERWRLAQALTRIGELTVDNPRQQLRLKTLERAALERTDYLFGTIEVYRREGFEAARQRIQRSITHNLMQSVLHTAGQMAEDERVLLRQRNTAAETDARQTKLTGAVALLLAVAGLLALWRNLSRAAVARRRDQEHLAHSEETLRLAVSGGGIGVWQLAADGVMVWSDELRRLLGASDEETASRDAFLARLHPEDRPRIESALRAMAPGSGDFVAEFRVLRRDGSQVWLAARGQGSVADGRLEGVAYDVTQRHEAEMAARLGEARLQQIMDLLPVGMFIADAAGHLTQINPAARQIWGGARQVGMEGYGEYKGWWPDSGKPIAADEWALVRTLRDGETIRDEMVDIQCFDGSRKTILNSTMPLKDSDGRLIGGVAVNTDITEFRRTEAELRAAARFDDTQRRALALFGSSFDRAAVTDGLLALLAEAHPFPVAALYLFDEWRGRYVRLAAHGAGAAVPREFAPGEGLLGEAARGTVPVVLPCEQLRLETGIADFCPVEVLLVPVAYQGKTLAVLVLAASRALNARERAFLADLAGQTGAALNNLRQYDDLKLLSEQLRIRSEEISAKNQQLEEASKMKSEFLANMSHELRTPLNAIIGFSEVLRDGLAGPLDTRQSDYVNDIYESGAHLLALINDILDLSKVEAGRMSLELEEVSPAKLVESALAIVHESAVSHRLTLHADCSGAPGTLWLDERKAKQILYNLLSNAVKFTPEGGRVEVAARRIDDDGQPCLEIAVSDTGIGIGAADQVRLFQPFVQIDSSLARQYAGTGLGLAMVRRLAELHGGSAMLASTPGQGSTFTVRLPWRTEAVAEAASEAKALPPAVAPAQSLSAPPRGRRVLVIEDDDRAADLLRLQLESAGFTVTRAAAGAAALALAERTPPDLITLDIMLPDIDGWTLLGRIKETPALAAIPVVIVSIVADRQRGLALGAAQVLQKPVERNELLAALAAAGVATPAADGGTHVLVVDDDPKAVQLIGTFLTAGGYTVEEAYGGREAIDAVRRAPPALVVLDLMMPEMSGFEVIETLQHDPRLQKIPVLVVTAAELDAATRERLRGSVQRIIEKAAFDRDAFLGEVRRALAGRTPAQTKE